MSQVTGALTIADGAAANKTFAPMQVAPALSIFAEKTAGISAGYISLSIGLSNASAARVTNRVDYNLNYPVIQTVNGVSSVASTGLFKGYFVIPDTWDVTLRGNLHAFVANGLDVAIVKAVIKDLDPMY
jgi:hypothetical protein